MVTRITITLTPTEEKAIQEIMERYALKTKSDAVSLAVTDYLNTRDGLDDLFKMLQSNMTSH